MHWQAHGNAYGVGIETLDAVRQGSAVVVNLSRGVLDDARRQYPRVVVLSIIAGEAVLRERLKARGRSADGNLEDRVQRAASFAVTGPDVVEISNEGRLVDTIHRCESAILGSFSQGSQS